MEDHLSFGLWNVSAGGYRWITEAPAKPHGKPDRFLTAGVPINVEYQGFQYDPMKETGLFRTFSSLEPTEEGFAGFANKHGLLSGGEMIPVEDKLCGYGERFGFWQFELSRMECAVRLWECSRKGDNSGLSGLIEWKAPGVMFSHPVLGSRWIETTNNQDRLAAFRRDDRTLPALHQLRYIVNKQLADLVSPRLVWNRGKLTLYQVPRNLLGALWLQLARAVDGDRSYRQCEACRNWYEVSSPDGGRADKKYCGSACRARAWRKEQQPASSKRIPKKRPLRAKK